MINLLPPERKAVLRQEFLFRLLVSAGTAIAGGFLALILLLTAALLFFEGKVQSQELVLSSLEEEGVLAELEGIGETNKNLARLKDFYAATPKISSLLERVSAHLPERVELQSLVYAPASVVKESGKERKKRATLTISGLAQTREALLQLKANLEQDPSFTEVSFPLSSLTSRTNASFSATMEIQEFPHD